MPRRPKRRERGMVLVMALFTMAALLVAATGALLVASSDIPATRNYRGAAQAHFAAESAILDALQTVNRPGAATFPNATGNNWTTPCGATSRHFGPFSRFTYNVTAYSCTNPANAR